MTDENNKPLLSPPDYGAFKPVEQVFTLDEAQWAPQSVTRPHPTFTHVLSKPGAIEAIVAKLQDDGFRRVHGKLRYGSAGYVMEGHDNQIIRIVGHAYEQPRPDRPYVLQPITSQIVGDVRIEILPKVHTLAEILASQPLRNAYGYGDRDRHEVAREILGQMSDLCKSDGYAFSDTKTENIAIVRDVSGNNVPLILDPGAILRLDSATQLPDESLALYTNAQQWHVEQLGLCRGRPKNVDDELAQCGGRDLFSSGVSRSERGHVIAAAMDDPQTQGQGFRQRIDHEWSKRHQPGGIKRP